MHNYMLLIPFYNIIILTILYGVVYSIYRFISLMMVTNVCSEYVGESEFLCLDESCILCVPQELFPSGGGSFSSLQLYVVGDQNAERGQ